MLTNNTVAQLDEIIRAQMDPDGNLISQMQNGSFVDILEDIRKCMTDLRMMMLTEVKELTTHEAITNYVSHYASFASNLCQILSEFYDRAGVVFGASRRNGHRALLTGACAEIDIFLRFVQSQYKKYFDTDLLVPFCRVDSECDILKKRLAALTPLMALPGTDPMIIDFALLPVRSLIKNGGPVTYRELHYLGIIVKKLEIILETKPEDPNLEMHKSLLSINFNSPEYVRYCIKMLHQKILEGKLDYIPSLAAGKSNGREAMPDHIRELEAYNWYIKAQKQVVQEDGLYLHRGSPSAIEQLDNHIKQEIKYIETLIKLQNGIVDGVNLTEKTLPKIRLNLSADQGAAWLASAMEAGIVSATSKEEAMQQFCDHFSTVGAEHLSFKAFRSRFFNIGQAPASATMEVVHRQKEALRAYFK